MKIVYTSLRLSIVLLIASFSMIILSCDDEDKIKAPVISSFTPPSALPGAIVTITGNNFGTTPANNEVAFNGVMASVTSATATVLVVTVPAMATTGKITVKANGATATSSTDFTVLQTTIDSFSPTSGAVGTTVTITGTNFSAIASENVVKFNGVVATVSAATFTQLTVTVPEGATTGKITVTIMGVTATSANDFSVLTLTGFSPASGIVGTTVTINGTGFSTTPANNTVKFNGTAATVNTATSTQLTVVVPSAATTGKITVTTNGTVTSATDFTVPSPTITNYSPSIAAAGISVIITGTNFSPVAANNIVKFNAVDATVTAASSTQLTVTVPVTATTGSLTVKVGPHTATSATNFQVCSGSAELLISDVVLSSVSSTSFFISFKITNVGAVNADLTQAGFQNYASTDAALSADDKAASGYGFSSGPTLTPGQSYTTGSYSCGIGGGGNTSSHPYLIVTLTGTITECNTSNNIVIKPF